MIKNNKLTEMNYIFKKNCMYIINKIIYINDI